MVTSNKLPEKKILKMADQSNSVVVPQRTLLGEVNEHITCPLCRGYYIDATTIVECLHSFCRSCIIKHLQVKSYCPVCEMMINSAKPNIKLDKALQDIVYKLVPGLFQKEMERRQQFYASRPGPAATATPEQRGEDTERIIFSPEDVISFSLEYADATDTDSISSKSSDSNDPQPVSATSRRYLQCPAVVNISHLKKFLSMKFDIDSSQFAIDILYKRVPLPDYYTLMDIAYIYNWKRNEPMRFFYQIIDYIAIRNRLFDIDRKGAHYRDRKSSPASTEDTNVSSPAPNANDQGSEASSGTDSPMPEENNTKHIGNTLKKSDKSEPCKTMNIQDNNEKMSGSAISSTNKNDDVEKSEFLNSFELTAKSSSTSSKSSPVKTSNTSSSPETEPVSKKIIKSPKADEGLKRKLQTPSNIPEMKKLKIELEKAKLPNSGSVMLSDNHVKNINTTGKITEPENSPKPLQVMPSSNKMSPPSLTKEIKSTISAPLKQTPMPEGSGSKRPTANLSNIPSSPKQKTNNEAGLPIQPPPTPQKMVSPLKLQVPKSDVQSPSARLSEPPKHTMKKIPDLKPSVPLAHPTHNKGGQPINKIRMDLLANNSDPTIDRSKILSQVKSSLGIPNPGQSSGDPLKSLFDSCKINIPSSLSITLTDQKQDMRNPSEVVNTTDQKKNVVNKNFATATNTAHKVPSPPVHNYIEILKIPDNDPKKQIKADSISDSKVVNPNKVEPSASPKTQTKSSEVSAKGPIPNLKPIADTKLAKQSGNFSAPITFQQTFEQQLQSLQSDKKPKLPKNKAQVPKLMPATPKVFNAASKLNPAKKINPPGMIPAFENKLSTALDLSTPSNIQSQLSPHQTKTFETMQSIANLAKKQNLQPKVTLAATVSQSFQNVSSRPLNTGPPMRLPGMATSMGQVKQDKASPSLLSNHLRHEIPKTNALKGASNPCSTVSSQNYQTPSLSSSSAAQSSSRNQTRSPSSSPKLVIAEEKQTNHLELNVNQSNQISSTQLSNLSAASKSESPKAPGPSKPPHKPPKPMPSVSKITGIRQPIVPTVKPTPSPPNFQNRLFTAHQALLRHQMDMEMNAWLKATQFMTNMAHQAQNDFNKDKP